MPSYIVTKRLEAGDGSHFPGDVMVDPDNLDILVARGYLQEVSDDHADKVAESARIAQERGTVPSLVAKGYTERAAKHIVAGTDPLPKYVQEEKAKIEAREAVREERTQAELDRLASVLGSTPDEVLDLDDEDYKALLEEHPSAVPSEAADPASVGGSHEDKTPFDALMEMPKADLLVVMNEQSVPEPTADEGWFKNDEMHANVVRAILASAGYSGAAVEPVPEAQQPE